ncbi:hypothetical protein [Microbacterium phyllosphaerae]|uniref:hypothetical protein n=1 Tax=Microbacterium phyllosphaerae TaxID=124798 RepID=UPI001FC94863|nr:hypothetical protein [Microbacterium phyllosphaerae]
MSSSTSDDSRNDLDGRPDPVPIGVRSPASARATGVVIIAMSIAVWWPAFTLGAWGTFFFDQLLTVWAASVGALIVVLFQPRGRPRVLKALALLVPSLWLVLSFVPLDSDDVLSIVIDLLAVFVALLSVPATIWVLARVMWPEFGEDISRGRRFLVVIAVVVVGVGSFALGANQEHFLTCGDFTISGNSEPQGCVPGPPS